MTDDIRQQLHRVLPALDPHVNFDRLWHRARRQRRLAQVGGATAGLILAVAIGVGVAELWPPASTLEVTSNPAGCPVTMPDDEFIPPAPSPSQPAHEGFAWYGTPRLWTVIDADGDYTIRKSVWWSADYEGGAAEQRPDITVTWERLDDPDEPTITESGGTNAHTAEDGEFMIAGIDPDIPGCWRVTASYRGAELSYVYHQPQATPTQTESDHRARSGARRGDGGRSSLLVEEGGAWSSNRHMGHP